MNSCANCGYTEHQDDEDFVHFHHGNEGDKYCYVKDNRENQCADFDPNCFQCVHEHIFEEIDGWKDIFRISEYEIKITQKCKHEKCDISQSATIKGKYKDLKFKKDHITSF